MFNIHNRITQTTKCETIFSGFRSVRLLWTAFQPFTCSESVILLPTCEPWCWNMNPNMSPKNHPVLWENIPAPWSRWAMNWWNANRSIKNWKNW